MKMPKNVKQHRIGTYLKCYIIRLYQSLCSRYRMLKCRTIRAGTFLKFCQLFEPPHNLTFWKKNKEILVNNSRHRLSWNRLISKDVKKEGLKVYTGRRARLSDKYGGVICLAKLEISLIKVVRTVVWETMAPSGYGGSAKVYSGKVERGFGNDGWRERGRERMRSTDAGGLRRRARRAAFGSNPRESRPINITARY